MTGFALKIIALISMLIDHTIKAGFIHQGMLMDAFGMSVQISYRWMAALELTGRLAFPIFAFLAAEGIRHTRSRKRYFTQLFVFGLLSEFAFDMAVCPIPELPISWFTPFTSLNIFFTLLLGGLGVHWTEQSRAKGQPSILACLPAVLCVLIGTVLNVDYMGFGVALIYAAYFPKGKLTRLAAMAGVLAILYIGYLSYWFTALNAVCIMYFLACCVSLALLALYNGQRGRKIKWLFYAAYPAHLYILLLMRYLTR